MSKNSLIYFLLWILFQLLFEVNCQMTPFKPGVINRHTTTLIDNKLYILGGKDAKDNAIPKDFFYLDVSVTFNTQNLLWLDLSNIDMVPPHYFAASVKGGANNDTLFLYGGFTVTGQTMELVYTFDSQSITWSSPPITGVNPSPIRKSELTGVNHDGKMYLWGGNTFDGTIYTFLNDMLILDTINLSWGKGSLVNVPTPRCDYGATLLPNNNIIYIGGIDSVTTGDPKTLNIVQGDALTLSEVYLYDTINDIWSTKATSGKIPSNRASFSTVLGLDGQRIIIFGGAFINPGYLDTTLYVLDLTNFSWYVPKISGKIPSPRIYHQTNVIGKYMVVSFGYGYDNTIESDILLLDISNNEEYVWTTTFDPTVPNNVLPSSTSSLPSFTSTSSPSLPSPSSLSSQNNASAVIAGAIVGSLVSGILLSFGGFFLYKWNKNKQKQKEVAQIHGNEGYYNNYNQEEMIIPTQRNIHNYNQATNNNYNHGQEIIQIPRDENTTNHEPITPASEQEQPTFTSRFRDIKVPIGNRL
ncbi:hypothetical protein C1645_879106 [Glomus cerebriforme]|uniref:Galactose oxidase n=1 Tax=Glomus cerebriforme TaxID=658196 RepID=A0A397SSU9_9GLOM|nr:hypothetical protein C1645_879106 [Glomus cerebriforme]